MKWFLIITTVLFYIDLFLIYKLYNVIIMPLLIVGTIAIAIILLSTVIFKEQI